ncbi:MAG: hypothetical protein V4727_10545 [Verrucomicrobiota bacterium]
MQIFTSETPLSWGQLDLPLCGLTEDWFGKPLDKPSTFSLAMDPKSLWFIGIFPSTANIHPAASPSQFTPELWKYDVAELFLANPATGEYLEFNLTSNGAWWASKFSSVRKPSAEQPDFTTHIHSHHDLASADLCVAGLEIPLNFLKKEIDFGVITAANITIISDTPSQRYLSASKLPGAQPDFHQPINFLTVSFTPLHSD